MIGQWHTIHFGKIECDPTDSVLTQLDCIALRDDLVFELHVTGPDVRCSGSEKCPMSSGLLNDKKTRITFGSEDTWRKIVKKGEEAEEK